MTFTPKTIYKDLMRSVHPDLHPQMKDATARAQRVNAVRSNPSALRQLAISWGFVQPTFADTNRTFTREQQTFRPNWMNVYMPKFLYELGLAPQRSYVGGGVFVRIKIAKQVFVKRVIRTTAKCVVVDWFGTPKTVRLANIIRRVS